MEQTTIDNTPEDSAQLSRTERKKQDRVQKLLQTAAEVFGRKGYDKTSLEDIAERMDMRAPSLYHYVKTKEELFIRCADVMVESVFAKLKEASHSDGTPIQRLEYMLYIQVLGQLRDCYPNHIPLFVKVTSTEPTLLAYISGIRKKHVKLFRDLAEEAVAAGELKGEQWQLGLRLAFGALGSLHQWYQPKGEITPEEMAKNIAASLMKLFY